MTPDDIRTEYLRREKEANDTPQGADVLRIIADMQQECNLKRQDVVDAVRDLIMPSN